MTKKYTRLEQYLRDLLPSEEEVTLTFDRLEQIIKEQLPPPARHERPWWGNQQKGTCVETIAWMNAGWMVDTVDLEEKWVRFVRQ